MNIYLESGLMSLVGLGLSMLAVLKSLTTKAKLANVIFNWKLYFSTDLILQLIGTVFTVAGGLILLQPFLINYPQFASNNFKILIGFATIGYVGSDIASRLFSVVNGRINAAIDFKTTQADTANGTVDAPTPAEKPTK
jgi:hypothetical protein